MAPLRRGLTPGLAFGAITALACAIVTVIHYVVHGSIAADFHYAYEPAARAVLHGESPYVPLRAHPLAAYNGFLYPPIGAYIVVPFLALPAVVADILAAALAAAAVPAALWVLGVRDWRCCALALVWPATMLGYQTGNLTLPLLLGVALVWRYRDQAVIAPLAAAVVIALKLFFSPLLLWFVVTRRYRSAALAAGAAAFFVFVPWAAIGFAGLPDYPGRLSTIAHVEGEHSFSFAALLHFIVPSWTAAVVLATPVGLTLLVLAFVAGRRGRERDAFALILLAVLALTPLLEMTYIALLFVIVALYRPRLSPAWAAPLLIWGTFSYRPLQVAHVLVAIALTVYLAYRPAPRRAGPPLAGEHAPVAVL